jgi:hypothetical protein
MKVKSFCGALAFLVACTVFADVTTTHGKLTLIHATATQTPKKVRIKITYPAEGQIVPGPDVSVKFEALNWTPQKNGNHFHFLLDNRPFETHHSTEDFIFHKVEPGIHIIRLFPVYPWHESVKQQEALAMVRFYVKEKRGTLPIDTARPMLIYSTPAGDHRPDEQLPGQPRKGILIDWFLHNISMGSRTGYFVQLSVDDQTLMSMKEWRPHYLQGLHPGQHRIKLELLQNGKPAADHWNTTERTIVVR